MKYRFKNLSQNALEVIMDAVTVSISIFLLLIVIGYALFLNGIQI